MDLHFLHRNEDILLYAVSIAARSGDVVVRFVGLGHSTIVPSCPEGNHWHIVMLAESVLLYSVEGQPFGCVIVVVLLEDNCHIVVLVMDLWVVDLAAPLFGHYCSLDSLDRPKGNPPHIDLSGPVLLCFVVFVASRLSEEGVRLQLPLVCHPQSHMTNLVLVWFALVMPAQLFVGHCALVCLLVHPEGHSHIAMLAGLALL